MISSPTGCLPEIRDYAPGDERAIVDLFSTAFGRPLAEDALQWRFHRAPAGPGIVATAWDRGVLCAHCGVTPVTMTCQGHELLGGLGGTAMTHPDYRGHGLFARLYARCFERMVERNVPLFYAFPDARRSTHRSFVRRLGLVDVHEVPRFSLRVSELSTVAEEQAFDGIAELQGFDVRFDRLWSRVQNRYEVAVKRDSAYLSWRFHTKSGPQYRIFSRVDADEVLGYVVLKNYGRDLQIIDMLTMPDADVGMALVGNAVRMARREGLESVTMWLNPSDPLHVELERSGFQPTTPVVYFAMRVLTGASSHHPACDFRNWHLTMSDSDVF